MEFVGRINREIYKCITPEIVTDEVIITDERIAHIKQRHPGDYERFCGFIPSIIMEPEYIIADEHPGTAILLKSFQNDTETEYFRLSLRLITPSDNPDYINSILTFWKTKYSEYFRLITRKTVLYKTE